MPPQTNTVCESDYNIINVCKGNSKLATISAKNFLLDKRKISRIFRTLPSPSYWQTNMSIIYSKKYRLPTRMLRKVPDFSLTKAKTGCSAALKIQGLLYDSYDFKAYKSARNAVS